MDLSKDFVNETLVEFKIDGRLFKFKPTTAGDEVEWLDQYMVKYEEDGKTKLKQDLGLLNKCKLRNLIEVPYSKEILKKLNGLDKDWSELDHNQRWDILSKLQPQLLDKIITQIRKIDSGEESKKKV